MRAKIKLIALLLALVLPLAAACSAPEGGPGAVPGERMFTDDLGREVALPENIGRVVPSGPMAQMALFALAPDLLCGLATEWDASAAGLIAEEYLGLPCFGQLYSSVDLNVEELALAAPDLIVDLGQAKDSATEDMDALQAQTGIPTVHVFATLESMPQAFRTLGRLLGRQEKAEQLAAFCERVYLRTLGIMESVGPSRVSCLYLLGEDGLSVLAQGSYHAEVLDMLANNLAVVQSPSSKGTGNAVTMEQVALWNPELIIFGPGSIYAEAGSLPTWGQLDAVATGRYVEVPSAPHNWMSMPPSVQRYLGLIWLSALLYPEHCDFSAKEEVCEYYRLFYGTELSDRQYEQITANAFLP